MTTLPSKKQLNFSIEFLRILCTLMVIGIHTFMNFRKINFIISYDVLYVESFIRCTVPLFFMISGFFIFKSKKSSPTLLKQLFFNVVVPTLITLLLLQWFDGFLNSRTSFIHDLFAVNIDFNDLFSNLLVFSSESKNAFYLWYVFSLIFVYLWVPLLRYICIDESSANKIRHSLEVLCFVSTILVPTLLAVFPTWSINIPTVLTDHYLLYFLLGFEFRLLWDKKPEFFKKKSTRISSFVIYLLGTGLSVYLALNFDIARNNGLTSIFYRYEMLGVFIQAIALFAFFLGITLHNKALKKGIQFIGNKCFYIYLLHWPIMLKFLSNGSAGRWQAELGFLFYPLFILGTFISSLLFATLIQYIQSLFKKHK